MSFRQNLARFAFIVSFVFAASGIVFALGGKSAIEVLVAVNSGSPALRLNTDGTTGSVAVPGTCDTAGPIEIESSGGTTTPTAYATLGAAFAAVNAGTHTGTILVEVCGNTDEGTATATLNASGNGAASYTAMTITPVGGSARTISGATTAGSPMIDFNGADNVTVDGLNTGGNSLTIANTTVSATSGTATVRFIGGATGNTITNSNVQGSGTMSVATNGAVIFFSTDANTANGNDNNTISNNNIGPAGANLPTKGILGNGSTTTTAIGNSGIVINNNNIFDFFGAAVTSSGVAVNGGCNGWTITNNRFYQTATRTWTTGATHRAIDVGNTTATSGAQGFTITGNTVGFASNTQTGTYTLTGSTGKFQGIVFNGITGGTPSSINNNTVAAVSLTGVTSSGTSTSSPLLGIMVINGVAETNNNTIGSQAAINSLVFSTTTTTATDVYGLFNFSVNNWTSNNNSIGGIQVTNAGASGTFLVYGMRANTGTALTWNAADNIVGGPLGNTIALNATGTASQVVGMQTPNANSTLVRNRIRNLSSNIGTGTTTGASVAGIIFTSATPTQTVSQNIITGLTNTNATAASVVTGIQFTGSTGANFVERNLIGDLTVATNSATAEVNGIRVGGGTTTYRNNIIYLGSGIANAIGAAASNSSVAGINGINEFLGTNTFLNNSVYIDGAPTAGTGASFAFNGTQTVNTRVFRNNIFFNGRSNAGATGSNYAVKINGTTPNPTGLTINNNIYLANGAGGVFGYFNGADVANLAGWQAAVGQDAASIQSNPLFISTTDLRLQAGSPAIDQAANLGVTNDFDGDSRPGLNALFDIGADERDGIPAVANDIQATAFVDPANGGSKLTGAAFSPQASFTNNGTANQTGVTVRYRICTDGTCATELYNNTAVIASLGTQATTSVTFPSTSIATPGTYTIKARAELGTDTVPANDEITGTLNILPPLSGTYTVGSGGNYASLTNPGGVFDTLNSLGASSNVTIEITSDLSGETGAVALNELAAGINVLIKPVGGPRSITGSINGALIKLNAADNVRIDGSTAAAFGDEAAGGNPALRELTIQNTSTGTSAVVIALLTGTNGAQNNRIRNVNILGQDPTTTLLGISIGGNTPGTVGADNDGNRVDNCSVKRAIFGIYAAGASAANQNTGTRIKDNDLSATGADRIRRVGILVFNDDGAEVTGNSISVETNESADGIGIGLGIQGVDTTVTTSGGVTNALVARNKINGIASLSTTGFSAAGIAVAGGTTGPNFIVNNMITGVTAPSTSPDIVAGIFVAGVAGSTTRLYNNSVSLTGDRGAVASQIGSFAIAITGTDPTTAVELKNNIFYTSQTSGGGANAKSYAAGVVSTTFSLDSNYNDFWSTGANDGGFRTGSLGATGGTDHANLAAWQTAVGDDANSLEADPLFVSPLNDLHLQSASTMNNAGVTLGFVTDDFDGDPRIAPPEIGADEFADTIPPDTTIDSNPTNPSTSNSATFTFSGTDTGGSGLAGFECSLDGSAYAVCASPQNYTSLAQGSHTFSVRAKDVAGNVDPTPASYTWTIDAIAPDTTILTNPTNPTTSTSATFTFSGTDSFGVPSVTFQCRLDGGSFAACTSPQNYTGLSLGSHTFEVRAVDSVGNIDPTPASYTWTINPASVGPVTVTATAGNTGPVDYGTFKAAVDAINAGTHQGAITVDIVASTTETATSVLNSSGAGSASYTSINVRPVNDGVTIAGPSVQGRGLIELNGADNVTIDGDNPNTSGTNRNLTVQNTAANTVTFTSVIRIALATTVVTSADNNVIRNLNVIGSSTGRNVSTATSTTASENTTFGIFAGAGASTTDQTAAPAAVTSVSTGVAAGATANNLTIRNNSVTTAARAVSMNGSATSVFPGLTIADNTIGNPVAGNADQVTSIGITVQGSTNAVVSNNTVWVEGWVASSAATHGINTGVNSANVSGTTIEKNRINRIKNNNGATWAAYGINLGGGNSHIVRNNFVSGVINDQTAGTGGFGTTFGAYGIRIAAGTGHFVYHNSVHLYGAMGGTTSTNLTAAFLMTATTQTGADVRNNIFSNQVTGGNPTGTKHVAVFLPSGATSAMNLTLNNNGYYQGSDPQSRLAQVGTTFASGDYLAENFDPTATTPASNFRAYTSTLSAAGTNDNASFATTAPPPFVSNSDLHIPAATATRLESGGAAVGVTDDIDLETRNATTPDIGADEFAGNPPPANDIGAVSIISPVPNSIVSNGTSAAPQARFVNAGTAAQTNVSVRFTISGPGGFSYTDTQSIATINPNQLVTVNFAAAPAFSTTGNYTMAATVLTPDTNTSNDQVTGGFEVRNPVPAGTRTVGTGGDYPSLTNPGGIFADLNLVGAGGNIVIEIISDLTAETGAVALNQLAGGHSVTIKPAGGPRVISGTAAASNGLINLNGADNVTIDGSLSGGTDRNLTITNNQTGTSTVVWIKSANASNGANNNTIKNTVINGAVGTIASTTAGILSGSGVTLGNDGEAPNSNNTIQNNWIYRVQNSLYLRGGVGANIDSNWTVAGNELGSTASTADKNIFRGMLIGNSQNFTVTNNLVHGVQSSGTTTASMSGIQVGLVVSNGAVTRNVIHDIKNISSTGTGANGISVISTSTASNVTIANNFIYDVSALGSATLASNGFGINVSAGGGYKVYHNSVNLGTNQTSGTSAAMLVQSGVTAAGGLDVRNNIFANTQTAGATRYAFYSGAAASVYSFINNNDYFSSGSVGFLGSARATLADWQTATGQDANSLAVNPLFVSATDLHITPASTMQAAGVDVGITNDIDNDTRQTPPDIGADEIIFIPVPGTLALSSATYNVNESGPNAVITVNRTGGSDGTVTVDLGLAGGTATGGAACGGSVDYVSTGGTVTLLNGETSKTFNVPVCDDTLFEGNETFNATLTNATGGATIGSPSTAEVTIADNDSQPALQFSAPAYSVVENGGTVTATVTRTGATGNPVSVSYLTAGITALGGPACNSGVDFVSASGTLSFAAGETSKPIVIGVCPDAVFEGNETLSVSLFGVSGGVLASPNPASVVIVDASGTSSDFDGDGKADLAVVTTNTGSTSLWTVRLSSDSSLRGYLWGLETDVLTPADYDGDGRTDVAIWRPAPAGQAAFYILNSSNSTVRIELLGQTGDNPVAVADYDGDLKADPAVWRTGAQGAFHFKRSLLNPGGATTTVQWGTTGDKPTSGDFDGNGKADFAVYRAGTWWILRDNLTFYTVSFGLPTDQLVPADYDGDGRTDVAVFRASEGTWYLIPSSTGVATQQQWGLATDVPVPADYDADGKVDFAVYRGGVWYITSSLNGGYTIENFGVATDYPVANSRVTP